MLYLTLATLLALWFIPNLGLFVGRYLVAHAETLIEMRRIRKERFNNAYTKTSAVNSTNAICER